MPAFDKRTLQRIRVPLGFLFGIVFIVFARPLLWTLIIGGVVALLGVAVRAWAAGHIRKAEQLAISGPYAYTRNPLYLGSFIMGVGFTIASGVWWLALVFAAMYLGIYWPVMRIEEGDIREIFGEEFDEYRRNVPLFFPRLTVWQDTGRKFDSQLYLRYREYRAVIGVVIGLTVLAAKAYFLH
jgi:protein-S-isoprenylcysteine O-methyltransferase Ste14